MSLMNSSLDFFTVTVPAADALFREGCERARAQSYFYKNPKVGPDGETLNLGVGLVGPAGASRKLLVISGTHGIEGYAGAAIQSAWLHGDGPGRLPDDTAVVMVHVLNPWGMAWNRRENEDNIDIFRNLLYCDTHSETDPLFDIVDDALDLEHWNTRDPEAIKKKTRELAERYGIDCLTTAIRRGQHHRPKAMTYHGNGPAWSKQTLDIIVDEYLQGARNIAVIDIHTGFGDYGDGIMITYDPVGSEKHNRIRNWFPEEIYTPGEDADTPTHSAVLPFEWIESRIEGAAVTSGNLEFGTFPPASIGQTFNANHHYHMFGDPLCEEAKEWVERYRRFCYPEEDDWKERVLRNGLAVMDRAIKGLDAWGTQT